MIRNFDDLIKQAVMKEGRVISVAVAQDKDVLLAVENARENGLANAILVGDKNEIENIAKENGINIDNYTVLDEKDKEIACKTAVEQVFTGKAHLLMKGLVDTSIFLKAVLAKDRGLRTDSLISHISIFSNKNYHKLMFVTDPAISLLPDLMQKKAIIENAVGVAHKFGIENPMVAPICAIEKFNPKMPATVDARDLAQMNADGEITGCYVSPAISLDVAISKEAAEHKGYTDKIGGNADILLMPNIEAGNVLHKSMVYLAGSQCAGTVIGAKCPIVMTSRADSEMSKLYSIAAAIVIA